MHKSATRAARTPVWLTILAWLVLPGSGLIFSTTEVCAQSKFLYGMYAIGWGENEGITWNGSGYGMRTGPGGARLMTFWNDSLGMNTFFIINSNFPEGGEDNAPYINFLYKTYAAYPTASRNFIRESKIIPIYCCHQITRAAESHYLKFSPATRDEGNIIDFDTSTFRVVTGDTSYTISSSDATNAAPLIRGLTVRGGETLQLRPRDWNTRGKAAFFKLRFRFYSPRVGNILSVSLTNSSSRPGRGNYQLVNSNVAVAAGHSEVVLPFTLELQNAIYEAYVCRLGLNVKCSMP
jgi:hypothetical protein